MGTLPTTLGCKFVILATVSMLLRNSLFRFTCSITQKNETLEDTHRKNAP